MKKYSVTKYHIDNYTIWNNFVNQAKNATFLFHRDFMEYHSDRFHDFSLLIYDEKENLKAILPANRVGDVVYSHQGLTYGGLVVTEKTKLSEFILIFQTVLEFLENQNISNLELKVLPSIYTKISSDEIEYLAFLLEAERFRADTLSVINPNETQYSTNRKRTVAKGNKNNLVVIEVNDFEEFWKEILIPNLAKRHNVNPVHSFYEMSNLKSKFPKDIRQFNVYLDNKIVAGTTIFETENVAHSQYISGKEDNNKTGSIDFLFHYLLTEVFKDKMYFDFGISNENQGQNINQGLLHWKESFGARTIVQNFYRFKTNEYEKLNTLFL